MLPRINLRSIFLWTLVAACLSAVLAFAYRGEAWAMAAVIALVMALAVSLWGAMAYWIFWVIGSAQKSRLVAPKPDSKE